MVGYPITVSSTSFIHYYASSIIYSETYCSFLYNNRNHTSPLLIQATIPVRTVDVHQIFLKTTFKCLKLLSLYCTKILRLLKVSSQLDTGVHIAPPQCDNRLSRYTPDWNNRWGQRNPLRHQNLESLMAFNKNHNSTRNLKNNLKYN